MYLLWQQRKSLRQHMSKQQTAARSGKRKLLLSLSRDMNACGQCQQKQMLAAADSLVLATDAVIVLWCSRGNDRGLTAITCSCSTCTSSPRPPLSLSTSPFHRLRARRSLSLFHTPSSPFPSFCRVLSCTAVQWHRQTWRNQTCHLVSILLAFLFQERDIFRPFSLLPSSCSTA